MRLYFDLDFTGKMKFKQRTCRTMCWFELSRFDLNWLACLFRLSIILRANTYRTRSFPTLWTRHRSRTRAWSRAETIDSRSRNACSHRSNASVRIVPDPESESASACWQNGCPSLRRTENWPTFVSSARKSKSTTAVRRQKWREKEQPNRTFLREKFAISWRNKPRKLSDFHTNLERNLVEGFARRTCTSRCATFPGWLCLQKTNNCDRIVARLCRYDASSTRTDQAIRSGCVSIKFEI